MLFQCLAACSCDVVVLFMICVSGEIIIHALDISNDVYQLAWYQFDPKSKYAVWIMIARTQQLYYFASFKTVNCSLETFINVKCLDSYPLLFSQFKFIFFAFRLSGKQALYLRCYRVYNGIFWISNSFLQRTCFTSVFNMCNYNKINKKIYNFKISANKSENHIN